MARLQKAKVPSYGSREQRGLEGPRQAVERIQGQGNGAVCWFHAEGRELWPERNFHAKRQEQAGVKRFHVAKVQSRKLESSDAL